MSPVTSLARPEPPLADDAIRLEPLAESLAPEFGWVLAGDVDIERFTLIPSRPGGTFLTTWLGRYERGWENGSCAGFAVRDGSGAAIGFAAFVQLDLEKQQGEIGYVVDRSARGRGTAGRSVGLLTSWGFGELGLERIELHIDPANEPSTRVARRAGYRLEGTLRNVYFKEGRRSDVDVWARLRGD
jgi:RimJ/RimL family protein N-acetyltransferase